MNKPTKFDYYELIQRYNPIEVQQGNYIKEMTKLGLTISETIQVLINDRRRGYPFFMKSKEEYLEQIEFQKKLKASLKWSFLLIIATICFSLLVTH